MSVTVALPVLDGGSRLGEVLAAVRAQEVDRPVELLVIDQQTTNRSFANEIRWNQAYFRLAQGF